MDAIKTLTSRLSAIQCKLNAPKEQYNTFGCYKYRSCEDILGAVKPLLEGLIITLSDEITNVADRIYVQSTATISDGENHISAVAFAREALAKKGMDESQITGSAASYARKFALNGLLLIDDSKDADHFDNSHPEPPALKVASPKALDLKLACATILSATTTQKAEHYADVAIERATTDKEKKAIAEALKTLLERAA